MNKRSFFKSLALLTAGAVMAPPGLFIPKLEPVKWKRSQLRAVPNPDYHNALYEIGFNCHPSLHQYFELDERNGLYRLPGKFYPIRGNEMDKYGKLVSIPPFILV